MLYPKADLVLRGGPIFRSLHSDTVDALAVWSGRVLAGGSGDEMEPLIGPNTCVVELRGRSAVPGFNDAHQHLLSLGRSMMQVNLRPGVVATLDELLAAVKAGGGSNTRRRLGVRWPLRSLPSGCETPSSA